MDDHRSGRSASRGSVIFGISIVVLLIAALIGAFWWQAAEKHRRTAPETIEAELVKDPFAGRLFATMKQTHPKDLAEFTRRMSKLMRDGSSLDHIRTESYEFLRKTGEGQVAQIVQAPHAELAEVRKTQKALLTELESHDVMLCARFAMTGSVFVNSAQNEIRPLLIDASIAAWKAAAAGRDRPAKRAIPKTWGQDDGAMLIEAMRKAGMSDVDLQVFASPYGMQSAPAWRQCAIGVYLWTALDALPADKADMATAMIITQAN
ncbi:hypothetical protein P1X14_07100 [Sphingomonas sp. AOB5]|uniref:hypothetical protein n=1 Tax=Sphingomonas sp. AOB5 TaxID=3034017 RepID=UPI0023F9B43C|nr:hypothetical protein [Sphingomonas sp. AOB5]MDF7775006.1 hypothetical protein [Sphingomonas sp. AOB5]